MSTVFTFLSRLASLIVICTAGLAIYNICRTPDVPEQAGFEEEAVVLLPPPPLIVTPPILAQKTEPSLWEKALSYLNGPCHPILPSFIHAFNYRELRSSVIPVVKDENSGDFNLGAACDVFDFLQTWKYIDDPAADDIVSPATVTWKLRAGDCDDKACCLGAALTCIGAITRISFATNNNIAHAWCEICLGNLSRERVEGYLRARYQLPPQTNICFREDSRGLLWLNLDWSADYPGGPYFQAVSGALYFPSEGRCETF